ncbi:hypothetical protein Tco_1049536 [Tanacetum coccineum]
MANDRPMWGNNRAIAPTLAAAIVPVELGDNFRVKGHYLSLIKDRQIDGRARADPHKHITKFIKIYVAKVWYTELSLGVITTWEGMRQAFVSRFFPPAMKYEMDATNAENLTHHRSVMTNRWEDPKKKLTIFTEDIEDEDIKETTTFMVAQKPSNEFVRNQLFNLKTKVEQGQKNHQAAIHDLETKFGRLSYQDSTRPTGSLPSNTQTNLKPSPFNDKPYRPPLARNEYVNAIFTRSAAIAF